MVRPHITKQTSQGGKTQSDLTYPSGPRPVYNIFSPPLPFFSPRLSILHYYLPNSSFTRTHFIFLSRRSTFAPSLRLFDFCSVLFHHPHNVATAVAVAVAVFFFTCPLVILHCSTVDVLLCTCYRMYTFREKKIVTRCTSKMFCSLRVWQSRSMNNLVCLLVAPHENAHNLPFFNLGAIN